MTTPLSIVPAERILPLWSGLAPHQKGNGPDDIPTLTIFLPEQGTPPLSAVLICPGGGYGMLAFEHEGINEAKWLAERGVAAFVLKYRLPSQGYLHPVPLLDAQRAMRVIRSHAAEWRINPAKVGVMGFSAGGHLASTLETHFDAGDSKAGDPIDCAGCRPDFAVLVYPVITFKGSFAHEGSRQNLLGPNPDPALIDFLSNEEQVTPQTPPTILVHPKDDSTVPFANSEMMLAALQEAGVPCTLLAYETGEHGFGLGFNTYNNNGPKDWLDRVYAWLKGEGFLP